MTNPKHAVIFSHSVLHKDPRILRQLRWLGELGYRISTVGIGPAPQGTDAHYPIKSPGLLGRYFGYLIRNHRLRFRYFFERHLDSLPVDKLANPDLLIINEIEYLAWRKWGQHFVSSPTYLDLHEDHVNHADRGPLEAIAFRRYWKWQLSRLVGFVNSREGALEVSCVERVIADSYEELLGKKIVLIYNAPDANALSPRETNPEAIKLIHHGMGTKGRGIETTLRALAKLPRHFSLDLVLFATPQFLLKIRLMIVWLGLKSRVNIEPGVPLAELPERLNRADVSVIILSDVTPGHANSLPNKFFESVHAKLAIVTGPNPSMSSLVSRFGIGLALPDWSANSLYRALEQLTPNQIDLFKSQCTAASLELSSEQSKLEFLRIVKTLTS